MKGNGVSQYACGRCGYEAAGTLDVVDLARRQHERECLWLRQGPGVSTSTPFPTVTTTFPVTDTMTLREPGCGMDAPI